MFSSNFDSKISNESKTGDDIDREHGKKSEESESEDATVNSDGRKRQISDDREKDNFKTSDDICDKNEKDSPLSDDNHCRAFFAELDEITKKCKVPVENRQCGYLFSDSEEDDATEEESGNEDENGEMTGDDKETTDSEFYDTDLDEPPPKTSAEESEYGENDFLICRQKYVDACVKFGNVAPQKRILQELEKKTLSVAYRCLSSRDIKPLCVALVDNLRVEGLNLSHCDVRDEGCIHVAQLLTDNIVITRLNLSSNGISHFSMRSLSHALTCNKILQHLDLSGNKLDDKAALLLASGIAKNSTLLSLNLSSNLFCEESGLILGAGLAENKRIQEMNLSWNHLCGKGTVGVLKALEMNSTLTSLDLSWNGLLYDGSVAVSKCLKSCKTLTSLDVSHNNINWNGAYVISKGLAANSTLQVLKVGNNPLTTTGAMDLVMAVSGDNSRVRLLDMIDVAVLCEAELMAVMVMNKRKFQLIHGGVVRTADVLGERKEREITAMERVISYMKSLGLRPLELLRAFDKSAHISVSKQEFKNRLKKTGVPLWRYELESLAQTISSRSIDNNMGINYKKFVEEVHHQVLSERNRKISERVKREKRREYHRRILNVNLPLEVVSETDEENLRPPTTLSDRSGSVTSHGRTLSRTTSKKSVLSLPKIPNSVSTRPTQPLEIKQIVPTQRPVKALSMCAPLGCPHKPEKKKLKKKRKSGAAMKRQQEGQSWMSVKVI